jgi:hypothetical protein
VSKFEGLVGKGVSIVHFASPFANCTSMRCSFYPFPPSALENIRQHGAIPFLSWGSQSTPSNVNEPRFTLSAIVRGNYDSYIKSFAEAARRWGRPFFLRFNYEMNGNWFPWSEGVNGNKAGEYARAWRHVHRLFTSVGTTNASWVWCPNVDPTNTLAMLPALYPGDAYVDWTCLDGYNYGTGNPNRPNPSTWQTFDQLYASTYHEITSSIAPTKPMIIGEVASSEYGGSKAGWIQDMLSRLPTSYPKIRGVLWFDKNDDNLDWPLESSSAATAAFAAGIRSSLYASRVYRHLATCPIPAPSALGAPTGQPGHGSASPCPTHAGRRAGNNRLRATRRAVGASRHGTTPR